VKARPVVPRQQAVRDIEEAVVWYLGQGAVPAALGFIDAVEQAFERISRNPAAGSPRYAHELDVPGLRSWPLHGTSRSVCRRRSGADASWRHCRPSLFPHVPIKIIHHLDRSPEVEWSHPEKPPS